MIDKRSKIVLLTKTRTQNQGNQALSVAWRNFLQSQYSEQSVRLIERAPSFLKKFTLQDLKKSEGTSIEVFDQWVAGLLRSVPATAVADPSTWDVIHTPDQKQAVRSLGFRRLLNVRKRLALLNVGKAAYCQRLAYLRQASLFVINPAGEFYPNATDTALQYLIETRCAQMLGVSTAFVNLSFEVEDLTLVKIAKHVLDRCDVLEFRDLQSSERYRSFDGSKAPLVLPDGVLMHNRFEAPTRFREEIALAINGLQLEHNRLAGQWDAVVENLCKDYNIILTSNEWTTDYPFWRKYLGRKGVTCEGRDLEYDQYGAFLGGFRAIVSSRLHTCVLGLIAGAPVIPVETGTFKLSGFFSQIGLGDEPIRMGVNSDWQQQLIDRIGSVASDREAQISKQNAKLSEARQKLLGDLRQVFSDKLLIRKREFRQAFQQAAHH